jgi:hypothetical protein
MYFPRGTPRVEPVTSRAPTHSVDHSIDGDDTTQRVESSSLDAPSPCGVRIHRERAFACVFSGHAASVRALERDARSTRVGAIFVDARRARDAFVD